MKPFTPFHHPKRECHWCHGGFKPLETLGPHSSEHFCSSECAMANYQARVLDLVCPGAYAEAQRVAVEAREKWSAEVVQRLQEGRERARQQREGDNDDPE